MSRFVVLIVNIINPANSIIQTSNTKVGDVIVMYSKKQIVSSSWSVSVCICLDFLEVNDSCVELFHHKLNEFVASIADDGAWPNTHLRVIISVVVH